MTPKLSWRFVLLISASIIFIYKTFSSLEQQYIIKVNKKHNVSDGIMKFKTERKNKNEESKMQKWSDCPKQHFKIPGSTSCHKWLSCQEIKQMAFNLRKYKVIGQGFSKKVCSSSMVQ